MYQRIIAIDPGIKGAIAFWDASPELIGVKSKSHSQPHVEAKPLPIIGTKKKELDAAVLASWIESFRPSLAIVEKVAARPGQGVCSMFSFGRSYGQILGVLAAFQVPVELVTPQRWKATVLAGTKRDKDAAIQFVRRKYPSVSLVLTGCRKAHDGLADSLCLLEYGLRTYVVGEVA